MLFVFNLVLIPIMLVIAIIIGVFNGINKSKDKIYLAQKHKEIQENKIKGK